MSKILILWPLSQNVFIKKLKSIETSGYDCHLDLHNFLSKIPFFRQLEGDCEIYRRPQKKQPRVEDTLPNESRLTQNIFSKSLN